MLWWEYVSQVWKLLWLQARFQIILSWQQHKTCYFHIGCRWSGQRKAYFVPQGSWGIQISTDHFYWPFISSPSGYYALCVYFSNLHKKKKKSHTGLTFLSPINPLLEGNIYTFLIIQEKVSSPSTAHMSRGCMHPSFPVYVIILFKSQRVFPHSLQFQSKTVRQCSMKC